MVFFHALLIVCILVSIVLCLHGKIGAAIFTFQQELFATILIPINIERNSMTSYR